ncbi:MAG: c-type cytochrome [Acidobacteriaceae bacterium]
MRSLTALAAAVALVSTLALGAQTTPATPSARSNVRLHRALPGPKNLQVLPKDISAQDLIATMRGYTQALGVECSFCHAEDPQTHRLDFASDANPHKATARTMIRMVNEINTRYLATIKDPDAPQAEKTVTCGTCHRGHSMPPAFAGATEKSRGF